MDDIPAFDQLLWAVRSGDKSAQGELFRRYYLRVLGLLQKRWQRPSVMGWAARDAEDIAQSAIKSLIYRLEAGNFEIADERSLRNVLFKIAMYKAVSTDRREIKLAAVSLAALDNEHSAALLEQLHNDVEDQQAQEFVESVADKVERLLAILNERQHIIAVAYMQEDLEERKKILTGLNVAPVTIWREKQQIARLWRHLED